MFLFHFRAGLALGQHGVWRGRWSDFPVRVPGKDDIRPLIVSANMKNPRAHLLRVLYIGAPIGSPRLNLQLTLGNPGCTKAMEL